MSHVFSTPGGSLGGALGPAIVLFVAFLGLIAGVIIYHAVAYRTRPLDRPRGSRSAGRRSTTGPASEHRHQDDGQQT
jgi:hypothetical protein